jgi:hypothetical protein
MFSSFSAAKPPCTEPGTRASVSASGGATFGSTPQPRATTPAAEPLKPGLDVGRGEHRVPDSQQLTSRAEQASVKPHRDILGDGRVTVTGAGKPA